MLRYEPLHTQLTERLFENLTEPLFRTRPHGQNSIAWVLWHVGRLFPQHPRHSAYACIGATVRMITTTTRRVIIGAPLLVGDQRCQAGS
jgi:hypothetical protein